MFSACHCWTELAQSILQLTEGSTAACKQTECAVRLLSLFYRLFTVTEATDSDTECSICRGTCAQNVAYVVVHVHRM